LTAVPCPKHKVSKLVVFNKLFSYIEVKKTMSEEEANEIRAKNEEIRKVRDE